MAYNIILDTNFLLVPAQFGLDIFAEIERICHFRYQLCVIDKTIDEVERIIAEQRGKSKEAAKLAQALLKAKNIKTIATTDSEKDADSSILDVIGTKKGYIVATNDKELRDKIRHMHVPVIYVRNRKYLEIKMYK